MLCAAAIDLGAGSGRISVGEFDGERLRITERHRFAHRASRTAGTLRWDMAAIQSGIRAGLDAVGRALDRSAGQLASIGADAWGVDYGYLDEHGQLVDQPISYRDGRTDGMARTETNVAVDALYAETGSMPADINTLYQLVEDKRRPERTGRARRLLMMPDLIHRELSDCSVCEETVASTSGLWNIRRGAWSDLVVSKYGLDPDLLPEAVPAGTALGRLRLDSPLRSLRSTSVITPASHDTASAVVIPHVLAPDAAVISSGTWSLVVRVVNQPVTSRVAFEHGLTNEAALDGRTLLVKNLPGLGLLQRCLETWQAEGRSHTVPAIAARAAQIAPMRGLIDVTDSRLLWADDVPAVVRQLCLEGGGPAPHGDAELARVLFDSLAMAYHTALTDLSTVTGAPAPTVMIVGGGNRIGLLNQSCANATGLPTLIGPTEASTVGNIAVQLRSLGALSSVEEVSDALSTGSPAVYLPQERDRWLEAYAGLRRRRDGRAPAVERGA